MIFTYGWIRSSILKTIFIIFRRYIGTLVFFCSLNFYEYFFWFTRLIISSISKIFDQTFCDVFLFLCGVPIMMLFKRSLASSIIHTDWISLRRNLIIKNTFFEKWNAYFCEFRETSGTYWLGKILLEVAFNAL